VFKASYFEQGNYGWSYSITTIIITNCKSSALGMALLDHPDTQAKNWDIEELPIETEKSYLINFHESV